MLTVSVLGPVRADEDGRPLELGGRRQRAVLARLAAADGQVVSAERIIDDLWAGEPPPKALGALQAYVSHLRRALEPGRASRTPATVLVSLAPGYALHLPQDAVDAWRFPALVQQAIDQADPALALETVDAALACWSGRAYAECADAAWAAPVAARLEELRLVAVEQRATRQLELGLAAQAVPAIERHVHDHPLREDAVRLLALALYRTGRQADALAALRRARLRLHDELGVDPGPALRTMEADVLAHSAALEVAVPLTVSPAVLPYRLTAVPDDARGPAGPVRLRGRAHELERLQAAAVEARGGARVVWVGGEAGAGKTTLGQAFSASLAGQGWRVAWGRCPEVEGAPPAWAWTEALTGLMDQVAPPPAVVERLQTMRLRGSADAGEHFWAVRAISEYVARLTADAPLCVVLDDVHRADDRTLQVIRQAMADHADSPLLIVATHRSSEDTDQLLVAGAALAGTTVDRIELPALDESAVSELFSDLGLPELDGAVVRTLTERTGGNPLFVLEVARLLIAQGTDAATFTVPPGVREVLRQRVSRLPEAAQSVLRLASVVGRDVAVDVVLAVSDAGEEEVLEGLEAGVLAGLLVEPSAGQLRFAHALVRDTLYDDQPKLRRARLHARVLEALRTLTPYDVASLAHHAIESLTPATADAAAELAEAAARQADAVTAYGEAARLWRHAVAAIDLTGSADPSRLCQLLIASVRSTASAGDTTSARAIRQRAWQLAETLGDRELVARALTSWDSPVLWTSLEMCELDPPFVAALHSALASGPPPDVRCALLCELALETEFEESGEAMTASAEAIALARVLSDDHLLCRALNARYRATSSSNDTGELPALGDELLALGSRLDDPGYQTLGHYQLMKAAQERADMAAAGSHAAAALALASGGQLGLLLVAVAVWSAVCAVVEGRLDEALATYEQAARGIRDAGGANADGVLVVGGLSVAYARGDTSASLDGLTMMHSMAPDAFVDPVALALLDAGRADEARLLWRPELEIPHDSCWQWATALHADLAIRFGDPETARRCYRELLPGADEFAGLSTAALVFAPVALTLGELAAFLGDQAAADRHFAQSLRVCKAMGAELWADRTRAAASKLVAAV